MKKRYLLILIICVFSSNCFSQTAKFKPTISITIQKTTPKGLTKSFITSLIIRAGSKEPLIEIAMASEAQLDGRILLRIDAKSSVGENYLERSTVQFDWVPKSATEVNSLVSKINIEKSKGEKDPYYDGFKAINNIFSNPGDPQRVILNYITNSIK